jgi:hypothetical protein
MDSVTLFDWYFCSLAGMCLHPGFKREGTKELSMRDCAHLALEMMEIREEVLCQLSGVVPSVESAER